MRTMKTIAVAVMALTMGAMTTAQATLVNDNMSVRVKGQQPGNWEIGLGDSVGGSSFVNTNGDDPWVATNTYDFTLNTARRPA